MKKESKYYDRKVKKLFFKELNTLGNYAFKDFRSDIKDGHHQLSELPITRKEIIKLYSNYKNYNEQWACEGCEYDIMIRTLSYLYIHVYAKVYDIAKNNLEDKKCNVF